MASGGKHLLGSRFEVNRGVYVGPASRVEGSDERARPVLLRGLKLSSVCLPLRRLPGLWSCGRSRLYDVDFAEQNACGGDRHLLF